jgi:hypothetical protein
MGCLRPAASRGFGIGSKRIVGRAWFTTIFLELEPNRFPSLDAAKSKPACLAHHK